LLPCGLLAITASLAGKYHGIGEGADATSRLSTRHNSTGWPGWAAPVPASSSACSVRTSAAAVSCGSENKSSTLLSDREEFLERANEAGVAVVAQG
jgi:hypothetical protein